jgi:hypothetical protein
MLDTPRSALRVILTLMLVFTALGLADLFLTWRLIQAEDGRVLESNPVANWWLLHYGWVGMTAFKVGMTLVIGGLAAAVALSRPRTGERILVFACGAQAAVVLYSVLLIWFVDRSEESAFLAGPNAQSILPPNEKLLLLEHKEARDELNLSVLQVAALEKAASQRQELILMRRKFSREEWQSQTEAVLAAENRALEQLTPKQVERLQQMAWQQRGVNAFLESDTQAALGLTDQQQEKIRDILTEANRARMMGPHGRAPWPDPRRKVEDDPNRDPNRGRNQVLAVLTPEQAARWKEMTGEPFKLDSRPKSSAAPGRDPRWPPRQSVE